MKRVEKASFKKAMVCLLLPLACILVFKGSMAYSAPVEARLSLKPLDLRRTPSRQEIEAAGQLGGALHATRPFIDAAYEAKANLSFGKAIQAWNEHRYDRGVELFKEHIRNYPESPWACEAVLHVGCYAHYLGDHAAAEEAFHWILTETQGNRVPGAVALRSKAKLRLGVLRLSQDRFDEAQELFSDLFREAHDWRHRTYASNWIQRISRYKADRKALLDCGIKALAYLFKKQGRENEAQTISSARPDSLHGQSMERLAQLTALQGQELIALRLQAGELDGLPFPVIVYMAEDEAGERGHYLVLEKVEGSELELFDPQSGQRSRLSHERFAANWSGIALVIGQEAVSLPGARLSQVEMGRIYGGCCGVPRAPDDLGDPGRNEGPESGSGDSCGSPRWFVNVVNINLFVRDVPLWYESSIGPPVELALSYNSQAATNHHEPFGNKWQFSYGSYLVVDPSETVTIFMPDGRIDSYPPDGAGGYTHPYQIFNRLTKIAENHFELRFPDDWVYVYNIPSGTGAMQPFLVEIRDAHGQKLQLGYNSRVQLRTITDAMGKVTTLSYNAVGLVTRVSDPFGRFAAFEYDANRNLTAITDMGGYRSTLSFDADAYLTGIENQRGRWGFATEPADGINNGTDPYPPPGGDMWEDYRLTITNPLGDKLEYYYNGYDVYSWYVSPEAYIPYTSKTVNNFTVSPKTEYWYSNVSQHGEITRINFPDEGSVAFTYDDEGNRTSVTDAHDHSFGLKYNAIGRVTSLVSPKGMVTQFIYAANGVDLLEVKNGLGSIIRTYNATHEVTSVQDRMKHAPWTFTYNAYGQRLSSKDPLGVLTQYLYNSTHKLTQVKRDGKLTDTFTYDVMGRVASHTDASGLNLKFAYNGLNHLTQLTYPDSRSVRYEYSGCCPRLIDRMTDRAGHVTQFEYDAMERLTRSVDPAGRAISYTYDKNGNLFELIDPSGNLTTFGYDSNDRLIRKTYADGTSIHYTYDAAGLRTSRTNARGITTSYSYDDANNLAIVSYSDDTPGVTYTYDDFDRLIRRHDGAGVHGFTYDKDSRLTSIDGPWTGDTVTYSYDGLGRRTGIAVQNGESTSYGYDRLGRLSKVQMGAETYTYLYAGVNPLVQTLIRPNGSKTQYQYDALDRLTLISHRSAVDEVLREYSYTFNEADLRSAENRTDGDPAFAVQSGFTLYNYNGLNQLTDSTGPNRTFLYDEDGNMIQGYTPAGDVFQANYDAENRLESLQFTNAAGKSIALRYTYKGNYLLSRVREFEDGALKTDTRYVSDSFLPLQERNGNNAVIRQYAWGEHMGGGIGGLLHLTQGGEGYSYLYDGRGNVSALLDESQAVAAAYAYDAYGNIVSRAGTLDQPFLYSTKAYNPATGLSHYGYRFYSPAVGRWLTRDPLEEVVGGLNLYAFVENDPINWIDPFGLWPWGDDAAEVGKKAAGKTAEKVLTNEAKRMANEYNMNYSNKKNRLGDIKPKSSNEYEKLEKEMEKHKEDADGVWKKLKKLANQVAEALGGAEGGDCAAKGTKGSNRQKLKPFKPKQ